MVYTLINHRNDVKMFRLKFNHELQGVDSCTAKFLTNLFDVIFVVYLTISPLRRREYRRIVTETKSR